MTDAEGILFLIIVFAQTFTKDFMQLPFKNGIFTSKQFGEV